MFIALSPCQSYRESSPSAPSISRDYLHARMSTCRFLCLCLCVSA